MRDLKILFLNDKTFQNTEDSLPETNRYICIFILGQAKKNFFSIFGNGQCEKVATGGTKFKQNRKIQDNYSTKSI